LRVPTLLMDGKPQGVAITDASGSLRGLQRPGWRIQSGGSVGDELVREGVRMDRAEIYALYDAEKSREYQTFGSYYRSGPGEWRGSQEGDVCTINGRAGHLKMVNGELICLADQGTDAFPRKKAKGNRFGQEEGAEEFEQHSIGVCDTCAGSGECRDCGGSGVRAGDRQRGWVEEENGDRDREAMIERITRAATTQSESTPLPPRLDGMTLDQLRARHAEHMGREYAVVDAELADAWRNQ
jgi:hypothetical protein